MLSIRGLPNLIAEFCSKTNTKQTKQIPIGSLDIDMSSSHGLPCFDQRAHFVTGKIDAMEISQAAFALTLLNNSLGFSKYDFIILQISKVHLKNMTLETIRCDFGSLSSRV